MSEVTDALTKVQAKVSQRRLRFDDWFEDFDRLRSGRITREQFLRVLNTLQIELSTPEKEALVGAFTVPARGSGAVVEISYPQFLEAMRNAPSTFQAAMTRTTPTATLTQEEETRLAPAMKMLRQSVQSRSTSLVPPFRDMDSHRTGYVTNAQFDRCMPFSTIDPNLVRLMAKKYGDGNGNVYYMAWCRDVDPTLMTTEAAAEAGCSAGAYLPGGTGCAAFIMNGTYRNPNLSCDELLRVLREQFALYKLRCEDYFTDFDRFKTGIVSAPQFESALGRLGFVKFALTPENVTTLVQAYAVDPVEPGDVAPAEATIRVQYRAFLHDSNPLNYPVQSATGKASNNYFLSTHAPDAFVAAENKSEVAKLDQILQALRRRVVADRIYLTPLFKDFDRVSKDIHEHRTCTASRFARTLATQKLLLSAEDMALLIRKYTVPQPDGSASDEVNYYQFVMDVDPAQANASGAGESDRAAQTIGFGASRSAVVALRDESDDSRLRPAGSLEGVLQKIGLQAEKKHLRLGEYFVDFDRLRGGTVLPEQFTTALSLAGVQLQCSEMQRLLDAFPAPAGRGKRDLVDYTAFLRAVAPFAPNNVSSNTLLAAAAATTMTGSASATAANADGPASVSRMQRTVSNAPPLVLTADEQESLHKVQMRLMHDVKSHNALLAPFFTDFDRFRNGRISKTNFVQALVRHRFVLSEPEITLLCAFYAVPEDREQVEYRRFIRDVGFEETQVSAAPMTATNTNRFRTSGAPLGHSIDGEIAAGVSEDAVDDVLKRVCCFVQERRPRLQEFFPDGDELKHHHVSRTRFRHAVGILGVQLSEAEYETLEAAFACEMVPGDVDYPAFVTTIRAMLDAGEGEKAVTERRMGASKAPMDASEGNSTRTQGDAMYAATMQKIRRLLASRRVMSLPTFRKCDAKRRGTMTEGQFFGCLTTLGVHLAPHEATTITRAYGLGGGEMGYIRFSDAVDDATFAEVS